MTPTDTTSKRCLLRVQSATPGPSPLRTAAMIAGGYALVGTLWIIFSDWAAVVQAEQGADLIWLQTVKGWGFVGVTAGLLGVLVYRRARVLECSQQALAANHACLQAVLRDSPVAMVAMDNQNCVRCWNAAARELLGWDEAELLGRSQPIFATQDPTQPVDALFDRARAGENFGALRLTAETESGDTRELSVAMAPWQQCADEPVGLVLMLEDLEARQRADRLQRQRDRHRREVEAMQEAIGVIGHELRAPIAALRASAEYVQTDVKDLPDDAQRLLATFEGQLNRLTEMVNNMLEGARLASGRAHWNWSSLAVTEVCRDAVDILQPLVDPRWVHIETEITPTDLTMKGDADAIRRLLINLLTNAHKHTRQGRITITAREAREGENQWVQFQVTDTGRGMPPEVTQRLGQAFALNQGMVGADAIGGTGLGLAICNRIAAAHGGNLRMRSARGEGTTITALLRADLDVPLHDAPASAIADDSVA